MIKREVIRLKKRARRKKRPKGPYMGDWLYEVTDKGVRELGIPAGTVISGRLS